MMTTDPRIDGAVYRAALCRLFGMDKARAERLSRLCWVKNDRKGDNSPFRSFSVLAEFLRAVTPQPAPPLPPVGRRAQNTPSLPPQ